MKATRTIQRALSIGCIGSLPCRSFSLLHNDDLPWDDRTKLQGLFSLSEKGWQALVTWKPTPYGIGCFATEPIRAGDRLRVGIVGENLFAFRSRSDIQDFCTSAARRRYVQDYLWGLYVDGTDRKGYPLDANTNSERFYGMWIPGNGLNHSTGPNTVYERTPQGVDLLALTDVDPGMELYDDYRRHGPAPEFLKQMAKEEGFQWNFYDCNDFVQNE